MEVSMVPLRGVMGWQSEAEGVLASWQPKMRDDVECSASALWAGAVECRPLVFGKYDVYPRQWRGDGPDRGPAPGGGCGWQEPNWRIFTKPGGRLKQKSTDELGRFESHDAAAVVVPGVSPAERTWLFSRLRSLPLEMATRCV